MNKKIFSFLIPLILLIPLETFAQFEELLVQIEILKEKISKLQILLEELKKKEIFLSAKELEPGDTLIVKIKTNLPRKPVGNFGKSKITFFKIENGWLGILGIDAKTKPGKYDLILKFQDGTEFKDKIDIKKREFKVSHFYLTKNLIERGYTPTKIIQNLKFRDNPAIEKATKIFEPFPYFKEPFIYPLKEIKITQEFGEIKKYKNISYHHLGVDLKANTGTPVFAVNDGICRFSKELPNYGKTIVLDHGLGIYSFYLHLEEFAIFEGKKVKKGEIIGFVGNTGYSTAPHLHFSIKIGDASVDPLKFIEITQKEFM